MLIIGERINGMFKKVGAAIREMDKKAIQCLAMKQVEQGAHMLDVNVGPTVSAPIPAMEWLVTTIQEVVDVPLAIDSAKADVIEAGLRLCRNRPVINSTTAEKAKLDLLLPLARRYNAAVIGLTMNEKGVPGNVEKRTELALQILASAMEHDIPPEELYIDAIVLPVNVAQDQAAKVLSTISECMVLSDPPPHFIVGLSNVSQKCTHRDLINRTFLVMAISKGLDAAILDPLDSELMNAAATAELLLGKDIYCDSFLEAWKKKKSPR